MDNLDVTDGAEGTYVFSNSLPFPAIQNTDDSSPDLAGSFEQQRQHQKHSPSPMSTSIQTNGDIGCSQQLVPEPFQLQLEPTTTMHAPQNEFQRPVDSSTENSNNNVGNRSRNIGRDDINKNDTISVENKVNNKSNLFASKGDQSTHNIAGTNQSRKMLSESNIGSFRMDEEEIFESGGNFEDETIHHNMSNLNSVPPENLPAHHNSTNRVPPVRVDDGNTVKDCSTNSVNNEGEKYPQQDTLSTEQGKLPRVSLQHPATNDSHTEPQTDENNERAENTTNEHSDKFTNHEASLLTLEKTHHENATETAHRTQPLHDADAGTESGHIPQTHQNELPLEQQQNLNNNEVIELLDDDVEIDSNPTNHPQMNQVVSATSGVKRSRPTEPNVHQSKQILPGSSLHGHQYLDHHHAQNNIYRATSSGFQNISSHTMIRRRDNASEPQYISLPPNHTPTWENLLPPMPRQVQSHSNQYKRFELSLLNVSEFTITGLPVTLDGRPSSVLGFRKIVKEVSRGHGKAVFERDNPKKNNNNGGNNLISNSGTGQYSSYGEDVNPDGGKWRIPLGAYRAFYSYLRNDKMCDVKGIPEDQLKIASLGKARLEKGFPSAKKIISCGVPKGLATALAPFQRGGVEFVVEREGRALIADDMGLGKTIQSIASMSVYHNEWPLLILTPSSARYHWAAEFLNWLGFESSVNKKDDITRIPEMPAGAKDDPGPCKDGDIVTAESQNSMRLLKESEIHVLVAGKESIFPSTATRIVICSYGLATSLVESGKLFAGLFRCAIVDESHMLKNIKTKRTSLLVPILHATNRCILLSGTPALARPTELWPQLKILSTERDGWWDDEDDFVRKYVQRTSAIRRAELHTMLTGTVMIRRMKQDILKSLPSKKREKAIVDVVNPEMRRKFNCCMKLLREGKGVMAKIAKKHPDLLGQVNQEENNPSDDKREKMELLKAEYNELYGQKLQNIRIAMQRVQMSDEEKENLMVTYCDQAKTEVDVWYNERVNELQENHPEKADEELDRKAILNKMYSMTAEVKIPLIAELIEKWLADPTKGKLCVFAHHIYVLDEIVKLVGLSNAQGSRKRFIRIDGSTSPKERQAQIVAFQNDPDIRIAVLGITAAGVAVTLTASSTVWFAELFWTPALMIQAEDRCHRIGQNATVKCLYFVATGTLDVLLWDLLEKKFQDLGEFVEGKEKMKIVVQHTYNSVKELRLTFVRPDDDDLDDDMKQGENEHVPEGDDLINLEKDLQEDIVQLAHEEMVMISQGEDDDITDTRIAGKPSRDENIANPKSGLGQTEDEAICLSDDDEDTPPNRNDTEESTSSKSTTGENNDTSSSRNSGGESNYVFSKSRVLHKYRFYKQYFEGSSYGIQLLYVAHRLAVANNSFGKMKPALGDVLVAVNGHRIPLACPLEQACRYMKEVISKGSVELIFVEDDVFVKQFSASILETSKGFEATRYQSRNKKPRSDVPKNSEDVIEILDDD